MKKIVLASLVIIIVGAFSAYAGPITLTTADLIGKVEPGVPAGTAVETGYATQIISMYNASQSAVTIGDQTYTVYVGGSKGANVPAAPLPAIISFDEKIDGGPYDITGNYLYALLKFGNSTGQRSELYYLGGQTGTIDMGGSLSHVRLFNPVTVPEPSLIMLLGLGLGAVTLVSRRKK